jgi:hypothetical protein
MGGRTAQGGRNFRNEATTKFAFSDLSRYAGYMSKDTVEIPVPVLSSVESLDELLDWLTAQNPWIVAELREARRQDLAGEFKAWEPRHVPWPTESK